MNGVCANPTCDAPVKEPPNPNSEAKWCSERCRMRVFRGDGRESLRNVKLDMRLYHHFERVAAEEGVTVEEYITELLEMEVLF